MKSKVLLINADAAGTETLKNLVLPGVGDFEILDNNNVTPVDISNNFFVTGDDLGKPRGEVAKELLVEMNPDVNGVFCLDSVDEVLKNGNLALFCQVLWFVCLLRARHSLLYIYMACFACRSSIFCRVQRHYCIQCDPRCGDKAERSERHAPDPACGFAVTGFPGNLPYSDQKPRNH